MAKKKSRTSNKMEQCSTCFELLRPALEMKNINKIILIDLQLIG
jgi:hypothetical protein